MRQLQVQRKMLNSKDWTAALMVKSRQWRDHGKFREPHHMFYRLGYSELPAQLPSWGQRISGREVEGSRLPEITLKWGKQISDRQVELLQERGISRVLAQALQ